MYPYNHELTMILVKERHNDLRRAASRGRVASPWSPSPGWSASRRRTTSLRSLLRRTARHSA